MSWRSDPYGGRGGGPSRPAEGSGKPNPVVFFEMSIGGERAGRIEMELRADPRVGPTDIFMYGLYGFLAVWDSPKCAHNRT